MRLVKAWLTGFPWSANIFSAKCFQLYTRSAKIVCLENLALYGTIVHVRRSVAVMPSDRKGSTILDIYVIRNETAQGI